MGPVKMAGLNLLKTANETLTHWTIWVSPTAMFVSGGASGTV